MASSNAETFILPTVSSAWPCFRTAGKVVEPRFRLFLTSARSLRALAAFSRAAARCSGVRGGRATPCHLGFRIENIGSGWESSEFGSPGQRECPFNTLQIDEYYSTKATGCSG